MMQINTVGSDKAVELYKQAFDAKVGAAYLNDDGITYAHVELDVFGQCVAIMELPSGTMLTSGNTMQFCLHLGVGNADTVKNAYEVLKDGAEIHSPIGECPFSPLMFGLIDKFGVDWCVFE
jgi:PhnB protein